ncbi:MAG: hypothetical protein DCF26_20945 [Burkholderiales bacterium]|nr:MAG: hypothetical protein DCF26_20945 [Burkholderiales bacterium]
MKVNKASGSSTSSPKAQRQATVTATPTPPPAPLPPSSFTSTSINTPASRASQSMALPVGSMKRGAGSRWVAVMAVDA